MNLIRNIPSIAAKRQNTPSIAALKLVFGERAKEAKLVLTTELYTTYKSVIDIRKSYYNPPSKAYCIMTALNEIAETYGVESFSEPGDWSPHKLYVDHLNTGDSYNATLLYDGCFKVTTLGDYIEKHSKFQ